MFPSRRQIIIYVSSLQEIEALLPPLPKGWQRQEITVTETIGEKHPFRVQILDLELLREV